MCWVTQYTLSAFYCRHGRYFGISHRTNYMFGSKMSVFIGKMFLRGLLSTAACRGSRHSFLHFWWWRQCNALGSPKYEVWNIQPLSFAYPEPFFGMQQALQSISDVHLPCNHSSSSYKTPRWSRTENKYIISPVFSGSTLGPFLPVGLIGITSKMRRPRDILFVAKERRLYNELPPAVSAPQPFSQTEASHPTKEAHL